MDAAVESRFRVEKSGCSAKNNSEIVLLFFAPKKSFADN
jgi:hypothetical protein